MRIFFIGDIVGRPGRRLVRDLLPKFRFEKEIDFVVANGENAAGGNGMTQSVVKELFDAGVHVLTGGNHTWKNRDILKFIDDEHRIVRPANYPQEADIPGRGFETYEIPGTPWRIGVVSMLGRVFMKTMECPFRVGREIIDEIHRETPLVLVDFHAEATSEKIALGWHLDGLATAVIGTHTHVATADEMISPEGTAFQTDTGMTGPHDGVIGVNKATIIHGFLTQMPVRHDLATGDLRLNGLLIDADPETGRATGVERVCLRP